ncbi:MAG: hypothetical protein KA233_00700 [Novosphingobium sp.]|jgi:hypothetical protein|nr:hypothetical protein [Novosphingobium sp.]MBP6554179.1 hypothetical protein [Novosphingobium sp.]
MRAAIILLALVFATPAMAKDAPKDWHRTSSPDGSVSVMTPCAESELRNVQQADGFRIMCLKDGMMYVATSGIPSIDTGEIVTYEMQLTATRQGLKPPEFVEEQVLGYPAFKIVCTGNGGVACIVVLDHRPGRPLLTGAMAEGGPGTGDPARQAEYQTNARYFYQSLKVSGK